MSDFQPRASQQKILAYTGGKMGVSAVPGSGKTTTLTQLAVQLVVQGLEDGQQVLIVTLVNSAVDSFKKRINDTMIKRRLLANLDYRVRTLHGLAHDIVRERPGLVGLSEDFGIIDERESEGILRDAVNAWLSAHPDAANQFLDRDLDASKAEWVKGNERRGWPDLVFRTARAYIKQAKNLELTPEKLQARLASVQDPTSFKLARMGARIYADYQRSLMYRGAVDFADLVRLALQDLKLDGEYLARLQQRWPFILEDEAQDSSALQQQILELLTGERGNWVRVGDTNQAIYDTFTTANPRFLREFVGSDDVTSIPLPESGRSQPSIIAMANHLVDWTMTKHPTPTARNALVAPPYIEPTGPGDPQVNPPDRLRDIELRDKGYTPERELAVVAESLARWLPDHQDQSVGVLIPRNDRAYKFINLLDQHKIPYVELLQSSRSTRHTAGSLGNILKCLADPTSAQKLANAFRVWRREDRKDDQARSRMESLSRRIAACPAPEAYLWPRADHDWLATLPPDLSSDELELLTRFRELARRWHLAATLPIDQLILTLAENLFHVPVDLALSHRLAGLLRDISRAHPTYRLPELVQELAVIANNQRRFLGLAKEDTGFEPPKGVVTVTTMHKAKGLEWDRVYLLAANNFTFPSGLSHDTYQSEKWFVRDDLNLEVEALQQLEVLSEEGKWVDIVEKEASEQARLEYVSERLRLLYVGITRAKRSLVVTWNTGNRPNEKLQPAVAFIALRDYHQKNLAEAEKVKGPNVPA